MKAKEILPDVRWCAAHVRIDPMNLFFIACQNPNCSSCSLIPKDQLEFANYFHSKWNGNPIPVVFQKLSNGTRSLSLEELDALPAETKKSLQSKLPEDFDSGYQKCKLCYFYGDKHTTLRRHINAAHPQTHISECFEHPFVCCWKPPRPLKDGIPQGPETKRCLKYFSTQSLLEKHETEAKHKKERKAVNVPDQLLPIPQEPTLPIIAAPPPNLTIETENPNNIPIIQKKGKRKRKEKDQSDISEQEDAPRPTKRSRTKSPKDVFISILREILSNATVSADSNFTKIVKIIDSKAYIRSDYWVPYVNGLWEKSQKTAEDLALIINDLISRCEDYNWNTR